jgi:hypothetical protein
MRAVTGMLGQVNSAATIIGVSPPTLWMGRGIYKGHLELTCYAFTT